MKSRTVLRSAGGVSCGVLLCVGPLLAECRGVRASAPAAPAPNCSTTILTTFISGIRDWRRKNTAPETFEYMRKFYKSALRVPTVRTVVLHDGLPDNFTAQYATKDGRFSFTKVDLSAYDPLFGVNDVRYFMFRDQLIAHPEWDIVFTTDLRDVKVKGDPCALVSKDPERLYIQDEAHNSLGQPWLAERFKEMGGKYWTWFQQKRWAIFKTASNEKTLNCGIVGGRRPKLLRLFESMIEIFKDPSLSARKEHRQVNVDMAVLNWVLRDRRKEVFSGYPLHSVFFDRADNSDVYFNHKLLQLSKRLGRRSERSLAF